MYYVVVYAKMVNDKAEGIYLQGVYFGGCSEDELEAASLAKQCVNTVKGGAIFPKVYAVDKPLSLNDCIDVAIKKFRTMESDMINTEDTLGAK